MDRYLFVYYGGKMETDPKAAQASMAAWNKWFADMGPAVVDRGAPVTEGKLVSAAGVKKVVTRPVTGYSVIQAESYEKVMSFARKSPQIIPGGGQIAVYPLVKM